MGVLGLLACSSDDSLQVYITPTLDGASQPQLVYVTPTPATTTQAVTDTPRPIQPPPTPNLVPGVTYGPITSADYTPEPRQTALPPVVQSRGCLSTVVVPEVTLYTSPDQGAQPTGTVTERDTLRVSALFTDSAGDRWANTAQGWLPLSADGVAQAQLADMRGCAVLQGSTAPTTLLGLHVINGTKDEAVLEFVTQLRAGGYPLGTIKGGNGSEALLNQIDALSPETEIVYQTVRTTNGIQVCPPALYGADELPDPVRTAQAWMASVMPMWEGVPADYFEFIYECPAPMDWLAEFSIEAMRIANQQNRCLLLFSFPGGNPDMAAFEQLLPAYQYALENPCQPGRTHGIALHVFSLEDDQLVSESDVWIAFRHRILYQRLKLALPEAAELPVYITELGIGGKTLDPGCEAVIRDALQYTYQLEEDPYAKGFHLWNVGTGEQWYDISPCLPALADAVLDYYRN